MAASTAPIKIDAETDQIVSDAAHFLGRTKKDVVSDAVREYVEAHRDEIHEGIREAMGRLDGSNLAAVQLLTGFDEATLNELGGVPEDN